MHTWLSTRETGHDWWQDTRLCWPTTKWQSTQVANYFFTLITVACDTDKLYSNNALQYSTWDTSDHWSGIKLKIRIGTVCKCRSLYYAKYTLSCHLVTCHFITEFARDGHYYERVPLRPVAIDERVRQWPATIIQNTLYYM